MRVGGHADVSITFQETRGHLNLNLYTAGFTVRYDTQQSTTNSWKTISVVSLGPGSYEFEVVGEGDLPNPDTYEGDFSPNYTLQVNIASDTLPVYGDGFLGVYAGGYWYCDIDGNAAWDNANDAVNTFGWQGATPVVGDWNGDGKTEIGVYANGAWWLESNGNGVYDVSNDAFFYYGWDGATPVVGDWNGDGISDVGVYSQAPGSAT